MALSLLASSWDEIVAAAESSLEAADEPSLAQVDVALRTRFLALFRGSAEGPRREFLDHLARITDSMPARGVPPAPLATASLSRWRLLAGLMESICRSQDIETPARQFLQANGRARTAFELVSQSGPAGLPFKQLASVFKGMQQPNVSRLMRGLVERNLLERRRAGQESFYSLGLTGQLVLREPIAHPLLVPQPVSADRQDEMGALAAFNTRRAIA
jgi:DNA-binding transcriptional ArsR family regulator